MNLKLFTEVCLTQNISTEQLQKGDVAVLVDIVTHPTGGEDGAILELFNAVGDSLGVRTVPISAVAPLQANQLPTVRPHQKVSTSV